MLNIFRSELRLETLSKKDMRSRIERYCNENKYISCRSLKRRKVYTEKYIEATISRKDATKRMRTFFVVMTYEFGEFLCCFRHSNHHRTTKYASGFRSSAPRTSYKRVSHGSVRYS